jgi:hypothetical protein
VDSFHNSAAGYSVRYMGICFLKPPREGGHRLSVCEELSEWNYDIIRLAMEIEKQAPYYINKLGKHYWQLTGFDDGNQLPRDICNIFQARLGEVRQDDDYC